VLKTSTYAFEKGKALKTFQFGVVLVIIGMAIKSSHTLYNPGN
jgi:hypothetical protein